MRPALQGWRVVVPRPKAQAEPMASLLRAAGATPVLVPTIEIAPPEHPEELTQALAGGCEWIVFTSANAVAATPFVPEGAKVAAVGRKTAKALAARGIACDLTPDIHQQHSDGLVAAFPPAKTKSLVLMPRADLATSTLPAGLKAKGWEVLDVVAYRTVPAAPPAPDFVRAWSAGEIEAVCFTSGSTVRNLVAMAGLPHESTVVACIGPKAAKVAVECGLRVDVVPEVAEAEALVDALVQVGDRF